MVSSRAVTILPAWVEMLPSLEQAVMALEMAELHRRHLLVKIPVAAAAALILIEIQVVAIPVPVAQEL